jgi:hypothetical protein
MSTGKNDGNGASYVLKVGEDTLRYAHDLLADNERLRGLVGSLREERERLLERAERAERLAERETNDRRFADEYLQVEKRNNDLMNLYVASYRLHGTVDRAEVLSTIQEIVANLVGCEEHGVFEMEPDGSALRLVAWTGIDPELWKRIPVGEGPVGQAVRNGETFVAPPREDGTSVLTACVPLKLEERVTGAIVLFRLLPQKPALAEVDHELFDLLATHAATALYCTRLHAEHGGRS